MWYNSMNLQLSKKAPKTCLTSHNQLEAKPGPESESYNTPFTPHSLYYHCVCNKCIFALCSKIRKPATKKELVIIKFFPKDIADPLSVWLTWLFRF